MKIAVIGNDYLQQFPLDGYGGIETCVENLAAGLYNEKQNFFVVCPKRVNTKDYPFEIYETSEEPTSISKKNSSFYAYSVAKILKNLDFDVIWTQSHWSVEPLLQFKKPIICTFQDSCNKQYGWMKNYENVKYRFISQFQFHNWVKEDWEKEKSFFCYTGLEDKEFDLEIHKEDYFLWCAGLQWGLESKGLDIFIETAIRNKNHKFIAYGSGNEQLANYLYNLNIPNFEFRGALKRGQNHKHVFQKARGFFMPTRLPEALGRTVLESYSKGTPVYGSNYGSINELIENGVNGFKLNLNNLDINLEYKFDSNIIFNMSKKFHVKNEISTMLKESVL
jgi:glycosyltransferase involved in cell wall biosynthesis